MIVSLTLSDNHLIHVHTFAHNTNIYHSIVYCNIGSLNFETIVGVGVTKKSLSYYEKKKKRKKERNI